MVVLWGLNAPENSSFSRVYTAPHRAASCRVARNEARGKVRVCYNGERQRIADELRFACHVFTPWTFTGRFAANSCFVSRACELHRENASLWSADDRYDLLTCDYASVHIHVVHTKDPSVLACTLCICVHACVCDSCAREYHVKYV